MAKKSPSASKKSGKVPSKNGAKKTAQTAAKPKLKIVKKPAPKPIKKVATKVATKPALTTKSETKKIELKIKPKGSSAILKSVERLEATKPALMTKKGNPIEPEIAEEETALADATVAKAEKVGKVKPIRIEKGNVEDEKAKWVELFKKYGKEKAINYKMSDTFPSLSPLQHKVLGWGFILKNDNDRLEVLFETGIRMLISNYKQ